MLRMVLRVMAKNAKVKRRTKRKMVRMMVMKEEKGRKEMTA